jgi:hypothetical protein
MRFASKSIDTMISTAHLRDNPYRCKSALAQSCYMGEVGGELMRLLDDKTPTQQAREVHRALKSL